MMQSGQQSEPEPEEQHQIREWFWNTRTPSELLEIQQEFYAVQETVLHNRLVIPGRRYNEFRFLNNSPVQSAQHQPRSFNRTNLSARRIMPRNVDRYGNDYTPVADSEYFSDKDTQEDSLEDHGAQNPINLDRHGADTNENMDDSNKGTDNGFEQNSKDVKMTNDLETDETEASSKEGSQQEIEDEVMTNDGMEREETVAPSTAGIENHTREQIVYVHGVPHKPKASIQSNSENSLNTSNSNQLKRKMEHREETSEKKIEVIVIADDSDTDETATTPKPTSHTEDETTAKYRAREHVIYVQKTNVLPLPGK